MNMPAQRLVDNPFGDSPVIAAPAGVAGQAMIAREVENIRIAMLVARQFPRDVKRAVDRILNAFSRVGLCEAAQYEYSRGGSKITGLSIRAAEELARQWGNVRCGVEEVARDGDTSQIRAYAQDLETGFMDEKTFHVKHWRDRSEARGGGYVVTEERDVYELTANIAARRKRACILTVIPADVQDAAERQIELTLRTKADISAESLKLMVEAFAAYGVTQEHIEARIQRHLDAITPAQLVTLRRIYNSLRDGMSEAAQWFVLSPAAGAADPAVPPSAAGASGGTASNATTRTDAVKEKLQARQGKRGGTGAKDSGQQVGIPYFSKESAIEALNACDTAEELEATWKAIAKDFADTGRQLPLEIELAKHARLRTIEQKR